MRGERPHLGGGLECPLYLLVSPSPGPPSGCVSGLVAPTASEEPPPSGIALITPISVGMGREEARGAAAE